MEAAELPNPAAPVPGPVAESPVRPRIGELLVRAGKLTPEQLAEALAAQPQLGRRLGEIVVARGWASTRAVAEALAEQHGLEYVDLSRVPPDPAVVGLLPEQFARRHQALPVRFLAENLVQVAVSDPTDHAALDDLRLALGVSFRPAVAARDAIGATIQRWYRVPVEVRESGPGAELDEPTLGDALDQAAATAPTIDLVNSIITEATNDGASDIHFDPMPTELVVRARIDGVLRRMMSIPKGMQRAVSARLKVMGNLDIAEKRAPQDGGFSLLFGGQPVDVRMAVVPTKHGEHVVLRILRRAVKLDLPELGMSPEAERIFLRAIRQPYGAVIATGPTGSGKTTTLYGALDLLNDVARAIATIEDPVEYQIRGVNQVEVQTRANLTFAAGLRTILRSDPDVILIGEIRDEETAKIAIQAAMTGHLVLTTLHTNDAASAIARLKEMGTEPSVLATSINCIVAQRLARRLCSHCREPYQADQASLAAVGIGGSDITLFRPGEGGCLLCSGTGYRGRVGVYEVMPVSGRVKALIGASTEEILAAAIEQGMTTLREDAIRLILAGVTSLDEARRVIGDLIA